MIVILVLTVETLLIFIIAPLLQLEVSNNLPIPAWLPNKTISNGIFLTIYAVNSVATIVATLTGSINELLFSTLLITACEHLDLLTQRIISIPNVIKSAKMNKMPLLEVAGLEKKLFIEFIKDHQRAYS